MTFEFRVRTAGLFLLVGFLAGCGGQQAPPAASPGEKVGSPTTVTTGVENSTTTAKSASTKSTGTASGGTPNQVPDNAAVPPPTFVREKVVREFYPDQKPKVVRHVSIYSDDSQIESGDYQEYYANGQLFVQGRYRDGKRDGAWKYWHDNGKPAKTVTYRDGKLDGKWDVYRADGTKEATRSFRNGKRHGEWARYNAKGKVVQKRAYVDGKLQRPPDSAAGEQGTASPTPSSS